MGKSLSNEIGRIAQGIRDLFGNDTVDYIPRREVPANTIVTYANFICDFRPLKSEQYRVRLTVGGDKLQYEYDVSSPAASLMETKLFLNKNISIRSHDNVKICYFRPYPVLTMHNFHNFKAP